MTDALWLGLAMLWSFVAMAWFALAKDTHWAQVMPGSGKTSRAPRRRLHYMGTLGQALSMLACLQVDPPSMAVLEWVMLLAVGATGVALVLTHRPRWLARLYPVL